MKSEILVICLLLVSLTGCDSGQKTATTSDQSSQVTPPGNRIVTHGEGSPIVVGENQKVVINDKTHTPSPQEMDNAPISAETHGDGSPVVVGNGATVIINYKK